MQFELELDNPHTLYKYNIYLSIAGYNAEGERVCFGSHTLPSGKKAAGPAAAVCGPCHRAEGYVSIIAASLPASQKVGDLPPLRAEITARADGRELFRNSYEVNPWGGLSLAGIPLERP